LTYYVPKDTAEVSILSSEVEGQLTYNGYAAFDVSGNTLLTSLVADNVKTIVASVCALTAKSIGDILYKANSIATEDYYLAFNGGGNAIQSQVNTYLLDTYSASYATIYTNLVTILGGTILIDTV
jgi:hypothetical protein